MARTGGKSGKRRVAEWLVANVGKGNTFRWLDVMHAYPNETNITRRGRELRKLGWVIDTYREDPGLAVNEQRLVTVGTMPA
jgi:hypothetical protein